MNDVVYTADSDRANELAFEKATVTGTTYYVKQVIYGTHKDKSEYQVLPEELATFKNSKHIIFKTNGKKTSKIRRKK